MEIRDCRGKNTFSTDEIINRNDADMEFSVSVYKQISAWLNVVSWATVPLLVLGGYCVWRVKFTSSWRIFWIFSGVWMLFTLVWAGYTRYSSVRYGALCGFLLVILAAGGGGLIFGWSARHLSWKKAYLLNVLLIVCLTGAASWKLFHHRDRKDYLREQGERFAGMVPADRPVAVFTNHTESRRILYYAGLSHRQAVLNAVGKPTGEDAAVLAAIKEEAGNARQSGMPIFLFWQGGEPGEFGKKWNARYHNDLFALKDQVTASRKVFEIYEYQDRAAAQIARADRLPPGEPAGVANWIQLALPERLYAQPGQTLTIYFDSLILVPNYRNFVFEFRVDGRRQGRLFHDRWEWQVPAGGRFRLAVAVRDGLDWVVARKELEVFSGGAPGAGSAQRPRVGLCGEKWWINPLLNRLPENFMQWVPGGTYDCAVIFPELEPFWNAPETLQPRRIENTVRAVVAQLELIRRDNPNCRILIGLPLTSGPQDAYGKTYGNLSRWEYRRNQHQLVQALLAHPAVRAGAAGFSAVYLGLDADTAFVEQSPLQLSQSGAERGAYQLQHEITSLVRNDRATRNKEQSKP